MSKKEIKVKYETPMNEIVTKEALKVKFMELVFALSCTVVAVALTIPAQAQDCTAWAQSMNNYFTPKIDQYHLGVVEVKLATNRSDGHFVSYGEMPSYSQPGGAGQFVYVPAKNPFPAYLTGNLAVFFSDRRYSQPGNLLNYPFDPSRTDSQTYTVWLGYYPNYGIAPGLVTWSGGSFQGQCMATPTSQGLIYGLYQNSALDFSLFNWGIEYLRIP
jgi:hypothetical protein